MPPLNKSVNVSTLRLFRSQRKGESVWFIKEFKRSKKNGMFVGDNPGQATSTHYCATRFVLSSLNPLIGRVYFFRILINLAIDRFSHINVFITTSRVSINQSILQHPTTTLFIPKIIVEKLRNGNIRIFRRKKIIPSIRRSNET